VIQGIVGQYRKLFFFAHNQESEEIVIPAHLRAGGLPVLRRRFPQIPVVAISGAYECGEAVPGGIIADGFYAKGQHHPETLWPLLPT
jgi:hypothetical protein